jgi:hypothetical protein
MSLALYLSRVRSSDLLDGHRAAPEKAEDPAALLPQEYERNEGRQWQSKTNQKDDGEAWAIVVPVEAESSA